MRLDMDCVRDILLCVEENTDTQHFCTFADLGLGAQAAQVLGESVTPSEVQIPLDEKYTNSKIMYHIRYCGEAQLLRFVNGCTPGCSEVKIADLTVEGHKLVNNIREPKNWKKTKEIGGKIGAFGLEMTEKIAEGVATSYFKSLLGL